VSRSLLAVIPARGGSKRIERKNLPDLGGRPLIAWTIAAAVESGVCDRVIVSTEDAAIAETAVGLGAEVPFLRDAHFDDEAPVEGATLSVVRALPDRYDDVVQLLPSCPLRTAAEIRDGYARFLESGAPSLASCFRFTWANPWWTLRLDEGSHGSCVFPDAIERRSQELPPLYGLTGAMRFARTEAFLRDGAFLGPETIYHVLDWRSALDIDDESDLELARRVAQTA
jgi:N-acylneuraminate cytidylyltransferase